jgi:hypothetical protein
VSSFQKVGTFRIVVNPKRKNGNDKQGGNVASYFTTPDGRVLHLIAGPVTADTFLHEARWAVETCKLAQLEAGANLMRFQTFVRKAHVERLRQDHQIRPVDLPPPNFGVRTALPLPTLPLSAGGRVAMASPRRTVPLDAQGKVHLLLATYPMPRVEQIYTLVFQRILN